MSELLAAMNNQELPWVSQSSPWKSHLWWWAPDSTRALQLKSQVTMALKIRGMVKGSPSREPEAHGIAIRCQKPPLLCGKHRRPQHAWKIEFRCRSPLGIWQCGLTAHESTYGLLFVLRHSNNDPTPRSASPTQIPTRDGRSSK